MKTQTQPQIKKQTTTKKNTFKVLLELGLIRCERIVQIKDDEDVSEDKLLAIAKKKYSSIINQGGTVKVVEDSK